MPEFLNFPTARGSMNLAQKISTNFSSFGILLLQDEGGEQVAAIIRQCQGTAEDINREVFSRWLRGSGCTPVSWATLVSVLHRVGLHELASDIQQAKCR